MTTVTDDLVVTILALVNTASGERVPGQTRNKLLVVRDMLVQSGYIEPAGYNETAGRYEYAAASGRAAWVDCPSRIDDTTSFNCCIPAHCADCDDCIE